MRPAWLGSGDGWEYVGRNREGGPVYRRRVLRGERDLWQTATGGEGWQQESFRRYDGDSDRPSYPCTWRDHYVDGDPRKGYVTSEVSDAA